MIRKVPSKVIRTSPFIERRIHIATRSNNKRRRVEDVPAANVRDRRFANSAIYKISSGKAPVFKSDVLAGQFFDCYA